VAEMDRNIQLIQGLALLQGLLIQVVVGEVEHIVIVLEQKVQPVAQVLLLFLIKILHKEAAVEL
jgi:energy-converting hydrogenase Eha subunit C